MKRGILLCLVIMTILIFTNCGSANSPDSETGLEQGTAIYENSVYEYETEEIRHSEPSGEFSFRKDVEKTRTDYAVYYFESSIREQERQACIAATERMMSRISTTVPEIEIVVLSPESYDGEEALSSTEIASGEREFVSDGCENRSFVPASVPEVYDLTLLCFDERFVSSQDVEAAKNNACLFVEEYLSSHSEEEFLELLSVSGTAEGAGRAKEALEAFYAGHGVDCTLTTIRYQYGGVTFDYAAACEYARFYIDRDWQDETWETNPMITENFLHEDYNAVKVFFEYSERQMRQYQELFGFDNYNNDLSVFISNTAGSPSISFYQQATHTIYIISLTHLAHEYIHSVMFGHCDWNSHWKTEGFARYFSYKYDDYSYDYLNAGYNENKEEYMLKYLDFIGRDIDVKKDFHEVENIIVQIKGYTDPDLITIHYIPASSFIGFLVDRYGEQAVIEYVCSDNLYNEEWGKSYEELVQDWNAYIEERYSDYSRK